MARLFETYASRVRSRGEQGVLSALNQKLWLQYEELADFLDGSIVPCDQPKRSLRRRSSAKTSWDSASGMPKAALICGLSAWRKMFVARSWAMVEGTVRWPYSMAFCTSASRSRNRRLSGAIGDRELVILQRVVVAAVDERLRGQGRQLLERFPHRGGVAFDQPAAAADEERVAGVDNARLVVRLGLNMVADGCPRVPGGRHDLNPRLVEVQNLAAGHGAVGGRDETAVDADHLAVGRGSKLRRAADVVPVMVGQQDGDQVEPVLLEGSQHGGGIAGIYGDRPIAAAEVQVREVVATHRNRNHIGHDPPPSSTASISFAASSFPRIQSSLRRVHCASSSKPALR